MTIERGQPWGYHGRLPASGIVVASDAEARSVVESARRAGDPIPTLGLIGGDLCRSVGGRGDRERLQSPDAMTLPVDVGSVLIDGRHHWFVAHLVAHRPRWAGHFFVAMNAQHLEAWDMAPRSHPNDSLLDTLEGKLSFSDRWAARSRLASGSHVPHPAITERRVQAGQLSFDRPMPVWLDGEPLGEASHLSFRAEPDALLCVV